ncbi:MAG: 3-oxoacyl-ACP synthase [Bacteroidales bacterium]|jgi:3-oxoacyl-[acyl-carrier-protein] synthase-1|nr:3-oxoacyl-ACP synthase [Bacteroidales bacterium]
MNILGTNIISSLGFTTDENFENVKRGVSGIRHYNAGTFDLPEAFMASLIDRERLNDCFLGIRHKTQDTRQFTDLEKACMLSITDANNQANIDLSSEKTVFILSTTKGNVELINNEQLIMNNCSVYLWDMAKKIAAFFQNSNTPIVVSNACISGACAQIAAMRELESGRYDNAVVIGADFLSKFIISGFQSFKALSPELCKPFDKERCGLNLGEVAATIIFQTQDIRHKTQDTRHKTQDFSLIAGAIRSDANHISAPSRTGEGSYRALDYILSQISNLKSEIAFINAHGTATPYNDAMETQAITRAGLADVPVNSLKPFFGHTLGAAGVLESIISMRALSENLILKSLNFSEQNFEYPINISTENQPTDKRYFIKMLSGFGGCNAALLFEKSDVRHQTQDIRQSDSLMSNSLVSNGLYIQKHISLSFKNSAEITDFYRSLQVDYPKFFKMDNLSKLGFLAAEMIFKDAQVANLREQKTGREDIAVICFNRSSSLDIDTQYQATIQDNGNYFPSPSLFVYTLPNIVTGEIAIRHKFFGETSFYVSENFDAEMIFSTVKNAFSDKMTNFVLCAWIESLDDVHRVFMFLVGKSEENKIILREDNLMEFAIVR